MKRLVLFALFSCAVAFAPSKGVLHRKHLGTTGLSSRRAFLAEVSLIVPLFGVPGIAFAKPDADAKLIQAASDDLVSLLKDQAFF